MYVWMFLEKIAMCQDVDPGDFLAELCFLLVFDIEEIM